MSRSCDLLGELLDHTIWQCTQLTTNYTDLSTVFCRKEINYLHCTWIYLTFIVSLQQLNIYFFFQWKDIPVGRLAMLISHRMLMTGIVSRVYCCLIPSVPGVGFRYTATLTRMKRWGSIYLLYDRIFWAETAVAAVRNHISKKSINWVIELNTF